MHDVNKAKKFMERRAIEIEGEGTAGRKWLGPVYLRPYAADSSEVMMTVLEGSPPRAIIVKVKDRDVVAIGMAGELVILPAEEEEE